MREYAPAKPWQVTIDYEPRHGDLTFRVRTHSHGSVAFTEAAAEHCGGGVERDAEGYLVRCVHEGPLVWAAREIARMSDVPDTDH